jgi:hypothetical protein
MIRTAATPSSTIGAGRRSPLGPERAARKLMIVNGSTESAGLV